MATSDPTAAPAPSGLGTRWDASPTRPAASPSARPEGQRDDAPLSPRAGQRARRAITATGTAVVVTSFVFSFGNITDLGKRMGLGWLAYPLAPAVDLTVLALVWGERYASLSGINGRRLRPVRALVLAAGLGTWALNTAAAWSQRDYGKVALDSIAPALLMIWTGIGPWFLRLFTEIRQREQAAASPAEPTSTRQRTNGRTVPAPSRSTSSRPAPRSRRAAETGSRRAEMIAWVLAERAAGRDPSGADLDTRFGTSDYGRRVLREEPTLNGHHRQTGP
jgi:hypothetical protein